MPTRQKIAVVFILAMGGLYVDIPTYLAACDSLTDALDSWGIASIIRLVTLCLALTSPDLTCTFGPDISVPSRLICPGSTVDVLLWCMVELNMGIIGGCVTAMRPFVRRYFPRLLDSLPSEDPSESSCPQPRSPRQLSRNQPDLNNGGKQHSTVLKAEVEGDNESEEYILGGGVDGI